MLFWDKSYLEVILFISVFNVYEREMSNIKFIVIVLAYT